MHINKPYLSPSENYPPPPATPCVTLCLARDTKHYSLVGFPFFFFISLLITCHSHRKNGKQISIQYLLLSPLARLFGCYQAKKGERERVSELWGGGVRRGDFSGVEANQKGFKPYEMHGGTRPRCRWFQQVHFPSKSRIHNKKWRIKQIELCCKALAPHCPSQAYAIQKKKRSLALRVVVATLRQRKA